MLIAHEAGDLPPFPGKSLLGFNATDTAATRQKELSRWLGGLVSLSFFLLLKEVNTFLNIKSQIRFGKAEALKRVKAKRRALQDEEAGREQRNAAVMTIYLIVASTSLILFNVYFTAKRCPHSNREGCSSREELC
jgi:hypothetical protein